MTDINGECEATAHFYVYPLDCLHGYIIWLHDFILFFYSVGFEAWNNMEKEKKKRGRSTCVSSTESAWIMSFVHSHIQQTCEHETVFTFQRDRCFLHESLTVTDFLHFLLLYWNEWLIMKPGKIQHQEISDSFALVTSVIGWMNNLWLTGRASRGLLEALHDYRLCRVFSSLCIKSSCDFLRSGPLQTVFSSVFDVSWVIIQLWHRTNCGFWVGLLA